MTFLQSIIDKQIITFMTVLGYSISINFLCIFESTTDS